MAAVTIDTTRSAPDPIPKVHSATETQSNTSESEVIAAVAIDTTRSAPAPIPKVQSATETQSNTSESEVAAALATDATRSAPAPIPKVHSTTGTQSNTSESEAAAALTTDTMRSAPDPIPKVHPAIRTQSNTSKSEAAVALTTDTMRNAPAAIPKVHSATGTNDSGSAPTSPPTSFPSGARFHGIQAQEDARRQSGDFWVSSQKHTSYHNQSISSHNASTTQETASTWKQKSISELGIGVNQEGTSIPFDKLIEWINSERSTAVPHEGSMWDKVLSLARYFVEQMNKSEAAIGDLALDSTAAQMGYKHTQLLLEVSDLSPFIKLPR